MNFRLHRARAAALTLLSIQIAAAGELIAGTQETALEAQYAGCESAGWCTFRIARAPASPPASYRVRPDGVPYAFGGGTSAPGVRDRLNALLASMIHQHKRIELRQLRALDDGTFGAAVIVNEADVASDPALREILERAAETQR
jgi:hypothetical protein